MALALLDSSVVVAYLDADDTLHAAADRAVRAAASTGPLAVSIVTMAEVLTGAKMGRHDVAVVRGFFGRVVSERIAVDEAVAERASDLRAAARTLRMPDALVLATADVHADSVLTGDRRWVSVRGLACTVELVA